MKRSFVFIQICFFLFVLGCSRLPRNSTVVEIGPTPLQPVVPIDLDLPKVAIIIDDAGHNLRAMENLLSLPVRFNIAVLPRLKYSKEIAETLNESGYEIMLHQPMEPKGAVNPGPGAIFTTMTEDEIVAVLEENFKTIPHLVGLNNHMGSKATSNQEIMETVLKTTKANQLFFVDSLTTRSKVKEAAEVVGMKVPERDIFLDNELELEAIKQQMRKLKKIALKEGQAIGIGHFYPVTIQAIADVLPEFEEDGVQIVPVSKINN